MLNKVILMGNVGRSPHIFLTQEGREIANFSLATTVMWKAYPRPREGGESEWQSATDWHQITVFRGSTVRWIKDFVKRGDTVYVEGKLVYQRWTDKYNRPRITAHVVVSGQGGKVEHLRSSLSNSKNNPVKIKTKQDAPLSNEASTCVKDMNEDAGEPVGTPDNDALSDQFPQDTGETAHDH
ncbi:MAG: single-stranded DNA-binding protein [Alphaproteobacteria bacterium]|jgi:single-strand DNA-binding protein|nr:single-stranded DNA-binding protein [Alphaproteobacteria bacterium]MBP9776827.1 single-stranded DNA-binding protein [Alphaproteobacteria bacterium]